MLSYNLTSKGKRETFTYYFTGGFLTMNKYLDIAPEVAEALAAGKPVVAL